MFKLKKTLLNFPKTRSRLTVFLVVIFACIITMGAVYEAPSKKILIEEINVFENTENSMVVKTRQKLVAQLLEENNIIISEYDNLNLMKDEELSDGATLRIRRGIPFTVVMAGVEEKKSTTKSTVGEALLEAGVHSDEIDQIEPAKETLITENMRVNVVKVMVGETVNEESIAYTTTQKETNTMYKGERKQTQKGVEGKKEVIYKITYKDGIEAERELISEKVITQPTAEIVEIGTKVREVSGSNVYQQSREGKLSSRGDLRYRAVYTMKATAYDPSPAANGGASRTALGMTPKYGIVAVDPKVIPLGSRLYIESTDDGKTWTYGYAIAGDTGGAIKGKRIDLCFGTRTQAYAFGVKQAKVYVLE